MFTHSYCAQQGTTSTMSRMLSLNLIAALFTAACLLPTPAMADLEDGLVAYYPFNGNMLDESGHGHNGTVPTYCGSPAPTADRFGVPGRAYAFSNACINLGTALDLPAWNASAVSAWFLNDGGGYFGQGYGQNIIDKTTFYSNYWVSLYTDTLQFAETNCCVEALTTTETYRDNKWHHLVANANGKYLEMWIDGILVGTFDSAEKIVNNQPLLIGYSVSTDGYKRIYWSGKLDDFRLYNRALTSEEVVTLHNEGSSCEGVLPELSALISGKSGTQNARAWTITLSNQSGCPAENAQIDGLTLTQTYGVACTPVIHSPPSFPLGVGNIAAHSKASGTVTLDFSACANTARFSATIPFSANDGAVSGSKTLNNQFR